MQKDRLTDSVTARQITTAKERQTVMSVSQHDWVTTCKINLPIWQLQINRIFLSYIQAVNHSLGIFC